MHIRRATFELCQSIALSIHSKKEFAIQWERSHQIWSLITISCQGQTCGSFERECIGEITGLIPLASLATCPLLPFTAPLAQNQKRMPSLFILLTQSKPDYIIRVRKGNKSIFVHSYISRKGSKILPIFT